MKLLTSIGVACLALLLFMTLIEEEAPQVKHEVNTMFDSLYLDEHNQMLIWDTTLVFESPAGDKVYGLHHIDEPNDHHQLWLVMDKKGRIIHINKKQ